MAKASIYGKRENAIAARAPCQNLSQYKKNGVTSGFLPEIFVVNCFVLSHILVLVDEFSSMDCKSRFLHK
jgi:hypothetical protein